MFRRHFLKLTGGGIILSAAAIGGFVNTRTPHQAIKPWQSAGSYTDPRMQALSYAILAPNPHNRQPWEVELVGENRVKIYRDLTKDLPFTDPFERQLTVGMGCFLHVLDIAARQQGYQTQITYFPNNDDRYVASVLFTADPNITKDPLFDAILHRRSCKEPFQDKAVDAKHLAALSQYGRIITDAKDIANLKQITLDAFEVEYTTHITLKESVDLMRLGKTEVNAQPDGIDLQGPMLEALMLTGIINKKSLLDPNSSVYQQGLSDYLNMLRQTANYVMIISNGNSRLDQIEAGKQWVRLNLATTAMGLALHPVSQTLQEYVEQTPNYTKIHTQYAQSGQTIQMLGRLGYAAIPAQSPRWPIEKKVIS